QFHRRRNLEHERLRRAEFADEINALDLDRPEADVRRECQLDSAAAFESQPRLRVHFALEREIRLDRVERNHLAQKSVSTAKIQFQFSLLDRKNEAGICERVAAGAVPRRGEIESE